MRGSIVAFALAACLAGQALAQAQPGPMDVMATITRFTDAVNGGDMPGALGYLGPSPTLVEDLAPYRWQGAGAGVAWIAAMAANAQAKGITLINMRLGTASRIEVESASAYAVLPGALTYTFKDGHAEYADGVLTFALQRTDAGWKIDALTWTGPPARP
jgi:ketosteroid isomerase-like protein